MGAALSAGIEPEDFAQVSLSGVTASCSSTTQSSTLTVLVQRQSSITGRVGEVEKLRKWVWQPYGRDEVELGTVSLS